VLRRIWKWLFGARPKWSQGQAPKQPAPTHYVDGAGAVHAFDQTTLRAGVEERLKPGVMTQLSDEEQIAMGIVPPGWKAMQEPKAEETVSVTVSVSTEGSSVMHTVTGIKYFQLAETLKTIGGAK
jgi:hypothetical protein